MSSVVKTVLDESDDFSSFGCLPDEILLQILSKLSNLKTLCLCKLVSKRFSQIVFQIDTISFTAPSVDHPSLDSNIFGTSFRISVSVFKSLMMFDELKSLCIELPSSLAVVDTKFLIKWKINFGNRSNSFVFLSPDSICNTKGAYVNGNVHEEGESMELSKKKLIVAIDCLLDAGLRRNMVLDFVKGFPLLENVSIKDSGKRGQISLSSEKIAELRKWTVSLKSHDKMSCCYVPLLELPVSGYVMKGVTLAFMDMDDLPRDNNDGLMKIDWDDFEDNEEAAYSEAVMEIFKKHRDQIKNLW